MIFLFPKPFLLFAEGSVPNPNFSASTLRICILISGEAALVTSGHAGSLSCRLTSLLYSSSSWAHQHCLSTHRPHLMLVDLLFIQLCCLDMWNTSPINNWVMLCSPLGGGLGCSGEIKGVLWRLRHRSGTWSPWALWKQKRGVTGNREIRKK